MEADKPGNPADPPRDEDDPAAALLRRFKEDQARRAAEQQAREQEANRQREGEARERQELERARLDALAIQRREEEARRQDEEARERAEEARLREEERARAREEGERITREAEARALKEQRAKEAGAKLRQEMAARRREPEARRAGGRSLRMVAVLFLLLAIGLITLHFVPFDGSSFERAAAARFGMPVKIGSTHFSTLPLPALRFRDVSIGPAGEVRIATVEVKAGLRTLLQRKKHFESIELEGAYVPLSWFAAALWGQGGNDTLRVDRVRARELKILAPGLELPAFNMEAKLDAAGALQTVTAETPDAAQRFSIGMKNGTRDIRYAARPFTLPFAATVKFDDFLGTGTLSPSELVLSKFDASLFEGSVSGSARLRWDAGWSLEGDFGARSLNPARIAGTLVPSGRLEGKGTFSMRAATPEKLQDTARVDATFTVHRGTLGFVDLTRHLQGATARGGTTAFERMDGSASLSAGQLQLRKVRLDAGLLNAIGEGVVDPQRNVNARFQVELTSARGPLAIGGTVAAPQVKR